MLIELGWYISTENQFINGYALKKGQIAKVTHIGIDENVDKCFIKVELNANAVKRFKVKEFKNRFEKEK